MPIFDNEKEIKEEILSNESVEFFDKFVLNQDSDVFTADNVDFVRECLSEEYNVEIGRNEIVIVGSSKLGFALHEKKTRNEIILPAFRKFNLVSDIDLSICSPALFNILWHELSSYVCSKNYMPFRQEKLGDYLAYGWLRLDQLPYETTGLAKCKNLGVVRGTIRKDRRRGHPKVEFGLFHDVNHLRLYQSRSISLCRKKLENPL